MKKIMVCLCFLVLGSVAFAQTPGHLKGPTAKNYKFRKNKGDTSKKLILVRVNKSQLKGPAAKNQKVWQKEKQQKYRVVASRSCDDLKGPLYKNHKHRRCSKTARLEVAMALPLTKKKKGNSSYVTVEQR